MKIFSSFLLLTLLAGATASANNIRIENMDLLRQDTAAGTRNIRLNLSWENSWRTSTFESNYDAVWLFAKYKKTATPYGPWYHVNLKATGESTLSNATIKVSADRKGAYVYRSADGTGNMQLTGLELVWDYRAEGLQDIDSVDVCVYGIEMVYIPQGSFYVGDGSKGTGASVGRFIQGTTTSTPFKIRSEAAIQINNADTSQLWGTSTTGYSTIGAVGELPAAFPKGFKSFYLMKYAITQGQYRDFLNKLTRAQQAHRGLIINIQGTYYYSNTAPVDRNGIRLDSILPNVNDAPNIYSVNLDKSRNGNEEDDGEGIPCNYITFYDFLAYLDWAALRPITELEYEKACRGPLAPVPDEKAWGTPSIYPALSISKAGYSDEVPNATSNVSYGYNLTIQGPVRVGSFATANNTSTTGPSREMAGASYYGAMEMSGNLCTYVVDVANGRTFDGSNGDGILDPTAYVSNNTKWPTYGGYRGGSWANNTPNIISVSDRSYAAYTAPGNRQGSVGGRGGRTTD